MSGGLRSLQDIDDNDNENVSMRDEAILYKIMANAAAHCQKIQKLGIP
jgi:hypothetical protein